MRVLLLNTKEGAGGAGIAAGRLLHALDRHGVDAEMLVRERETDNPRVHSIERPLAGRAAFIAERLGVLWHERGRRRNLFAIDPGTRGIDFPVMELYRRADVVHLHWINQGMLSLRTLGRVLRSGKPVVWTLHDMWPLTGVCHHADECEGWLHECGRCPLLAHPSEGDLSHTTFLRKRSAYGNGHLQIVACSDWLADLARRAPLLAGHDVHSIPNPLDTDFYSPADRREARRNLGLPTEGRLLLFVAYRVTDPLKGSEYLREAVNRFVSEQGGPASDLHLVLVGHDAGSCVDRFACPVHSFEYVGDPERMRDLYRAADVLLMPTLRDNLPNTVAESMACGTPAVAFHIGGLPQMIHHTEDGYLARFRDGEDFVEGIRRVLLSPHYDDICRAARRTAVAAYSEDAVARRYTEVYEAALAAAR